MTQQTTDAKARKMWAEAARHLEKKQPEKAYPLLWKMNRLRPADPAVLRNLGACALETQRYDAAIDAFRLLMRIQPDLPVDVQCMLASAYQGTGEHGQAIALLEPLCAATADPRAHLVLGRILFDAGQFAKAAESLRPVVAAPDAAPDIDGRLIELYAGSLEAQSFFLESASVLERLVARETEGAVFRLRRAYLLLMAGEAAEAVAAYREALDRGLAGADVASDLILALHYLDGTTDADIARAEDDWVARYCPADPPDTVPARAAASGRPLRIGYISGDFCQHATSYFFEPVLEAHDRKRVAVYCYSDYATPDDTTRRLAGKADQWRDIARKSDDEIVRLIRADSLDVLVELSGHTASNRLRALARRAAPVQVSWLGYPTPTRVPAIDYVLCDATVRPPSDDALAGAHETPLVLDGGFHAFRRDARPTPAMLPPCAHREYVTFGCFAAPAKISPATVALWARVLDAVPGSRLMLKREPFAEEALRRKFEARFAAHGIAADRLEFAWEIDSTDHHLNQYGGIDIALDTLPFNGRTTTADALWMGVPVVALPGDRWVSRKSASLLHQAGLGELVADDADGFVDIARALAADRDRIAEYRTTLRDRLKVSPLGDARRMAGALEDAFARVSVGA